MPITRAIEFADYADVLGYLKGALRSGGRPVLELDFQPSATYAQRFLRETREKLASSDPDDVAVGEEGMRLLLAIYSRRQTLPGRPVHRGTPVSDDRVRFIRSFYLSRLRDAAGDRRALRRVAHSVPVAMTRDQCGQIDRLLRQPVVRLADLSNRLAAWHLGVSIRRVRESLCEQDSDGSIRYA